MSKRLPVKGQPDFSFLDDSHVRDYKRFINDMIQSYSDFPEKVKVLKDIWSDLNTENVNRFDNLPEKPVFKHRKIFRLGNKN